MKGSTHLHNVLWANSIIHLECLECSFTFYPRLILIFKKYLVGEDWIKFPEKYAFKFCVLLSAFTRRHYSLGGIRRERKQTIKYFSLKIFLINERKFYYQNGHHFYKAQIIKIFPSLGQNGFWLAAQLSEEISCFPKFKEIGKKAKNMI